MRHMVTALVLTGFVAIAPSSFAQTSAAKPAAQHAAAAAAKPAASHSVRGTIKSVDSSTLVITTAGKKRRDMTFMLGSSTAKQGDLAPGTSVSVRYTGDAGHMMATAVTASQKTAKKS